MACPYSHCASPSTVVLHSWHKTGTHFFHGVGSSLFHGVCNFTQRRWGVEGCTRAGEELRAMAAMQQHDTHRWASETLQKHEHVNLARLLPKGNGGVARLARALRTNETTCAALASFTYALGYAGSLDYALATRCGIEPRAGSAKRK